MLQVTAEADHVRTRRCRNRLRATRHPDGGLVVEAGGPDSPGWYRVDLHVATLTRAASRVLATDRVEAVAFADAACGLAGVSHVDPNPVAAILRATYPLLAPQFPFTPPALPASIPGSLHTAFRQHDPREAAHLLFPRRATRPVIRALCELLTRGDRPLDMWTLGLTAAASSLLEPDQLARLLHEAPAGARVRDAVDADLGQVFTRLVDQARPARRVRVIAAAVGDDATRRRVAYTLHHAPAELADHRDGAACWRLTAAGAAAGDRSRAQITTPPRPATRPTSRQRFTAHRASSPADLRGISERLGNCIDTYVAQLRRGDPLIEIREDGVATYAVHVRDGRIAEFKGLRNRAPAPEDVPVVRQLLETEGLLTPACRPAGRADQLSLQAMAADLLGPASSDRVDWAEVAAGLWALGALARLPDPDDETWTQVVRDLAAHVSTGDHPAQAEPRSRQERLAAAARLTDGIDRRRHHGWQRHAMASILTADLAW